MCLIYYDIKLVIHKRLIGHIRGGLKPHQVPPISANVMLL